MSMTTFEAQLHLASRNFPRLPPHMFARLATRRLLRHGTAASARISPTLLPLWDNVHEASADSPDEGGWLRVEAFRAVHTVLPPRCDVVHVPCTMHDLLLWRATVDPSDAYVRRLTEAALAERLQLGRDAARRLAVHGLVALQDVEHGDVVRTTYSLYEKVHG